MEFKDRSELLLRKVESSELLLRQFGSAALEQPSLTEIRDTFKLMDFNWKYLSFFRLFHISLDTQNRVKVRVKVMVRVKVRVRH